MPRIHLPALLALLAAACMVPVQLAAAAPITAAQCAWRNGLCEISSGYLFSAFSNSTTLNTYSAHVLKQLADMVACEAQANATACGADPACELLPCGACGIGAAAPSLLLDSEHEAGTCNGSLAARTKVCAQANTSDACGAAAGYCQWVPLMASCLVTGMMQATPEELAAVSEASLGTCASAKAYIIVSSLCDGPNGAALAEGPCLARYPACHWDAAARECTYGAASAALAVFRARADGPEMAAARQCAAANASETCALVGPRAAIDPVLLQEARNGTLPLAAEEAAPVARGGAGGERRARALLASAVAAGVVLLMLA